MWYIYHANTCYIYHIYTFAPRRQHIHISPLEDHVLINILQYSLQRDKYIYFILFFSQARISEKKKKKLNLFSSRPVFHADHDEFLSPGFPFPYVGYMRQRNARLKRSEFNAMQLFRVARDVPCGSASQSNFETIQNAEVTRVGVTCSRRHQANTSWFGSFTLLLAESVFATLPRIRAL